MTARLCDCGRRLDRLGYQVCAACRDSLLDRIDAELAAIAQRDCPLHDYLAPPPPTSDASTPYPRPARLQTGAAHAALDTVGGWVRSIGSRLFGGRKDNDR